MTRFAITLAACAISIPALAQTVGVDETADGQRATVPSDAEIQASDQIDTGLKVPEIEDGTQSMTIEASDGAAKAGETVAKAASGGEGTEATEVVKDIVDDAKTDPETGQTEAATGGATPTENWFGCDPAADAGDDAHCDNAKAEGSDMSTDQEPGANAEPIDESAVSEEATTVREPDSAVQ